MKKIKTLTAILLASSFLVTGCKKDDPTPVGSVDKVSILSADTEATVGYTFEISANVTTTGDVSKEVTWSTTNSEVASISATSGTQITVSALKYGSSVIRATSVFDNTKFDEFTLNVLDWTDEEVALMNNTIGQKLPYFKGNYSWSSEYYQSQGFIYASSTDDEAFDLAIETLEENGYRPIGDDEGHVYFDIPSVKESDDSVFYVELDFFVEDEISRCLAYLTETIPEWPAARINKVLEGYTEGIPETVPAFEADSYSFQKDPDILYSCSVIAYGGNLDDYLDELANDLGWFVYDYQSYYAIYSPRNSIEIECGYFDLNTILFVITANDEYMLDLLPEWPAAQIAGAEAGHSFVEVPKANGTNFTFLAGTNYFAQVNVYGGNASEYSETLHSNGFEKTTTQDNYSSFRKQDLLLDIFEYKTHFVVSIAEGPKAEWPSEKIASIIDVKVKVSIPQAPGALFRLVENDDFYELMIMVEGGLLSDYKQTLENNGFTIKYDDEVKCDVATKGKLNLDLFQDPDVASNYAICAYFGQLFPQEEVNQAIQKIAPGTTTVVPEFYADTYRFNDFSILGGYPYIEGYGFDPEIENIYKQTLKDDGWSVEIGQSGYLEAISFNEDVKLIFYVEDGVFVVEIQGYTKPYDAWPTDVIANVVKDMGAEGYVPEYSTGALGFLVFPPEGQIRGQIAVLVNYGDEEDYINNYVASLEADDFFVAHVEYFILDEINYYAQEGNTLAFAIYSQEDGVVTIELMKLDEPAKRPEPPHWLTDEIAAYVKDTLKAKGTVLEYDGEITAFNFPSLDLFEYPTIMVGVGKGNEAEALAKYEQDLIDNDYFTVEDWIDYKIYAQDGDTLRIIPKIDTLYYAGYLLIEIEKADEPAHKNFPWPTDEIAALVSKMGAVGSAVPEYDGERSNILVSEDHSMGDYYCVSLYVADASEAETSYIQTLTNLGYFVAGDNYGDPIYAKEGETLGISPYFYEDDVLLIELIKLDAPASK